MMHAFTIHSARNASITDRPTPSPRDGEALVRVSICGVCGSDLHAYEGTQPFFIYPEVPGHEVVGEIVEVRPRPGGLMRLPNRPVEEGLEVGERVVLDPGMPCGQCFACSHGSYNCCEKMRVIGVHAPGALAEFYTAPLECLHRVSEPMSDEVAALVEPVSIGVQANSRGRISANETVLIIGAGTIGLCVMLVAKAAGARVAMTDLSPSRRAKALAMGADAVFDPRAEGWQEGLRDFAQATGPAVVVEAVGTPATLAQALDLVVASGRVVQLGLVSGEVTLPGNVLVRKELDFLGSRLHCGTVPEALKLLASGSLDAGPLVSHHASLAETERMLRLMGEAPDEVLKALVTVT